MICEWTLRASTRVQGGPMDPSPSVAAVPGSGMFGSEVCTVRFAGSYTRS